MNTYSVTLVSASGQLMTANDSASLDITGNITIEAWIKPTSVSGNQGLIGKAENATQQAYHILLEGGNVHLYISTNGSTITAIGPGFSGLAANVWTHVAVTWSPGSPGTYNYYINGVLFGTGTQTLGNTNNAPCVLRIGDVPYAVDGAEYRYDGLIDEVRIWNTVRTVTEILNNYQRELAGNESGLAAYYKFNNAYTDSTANANNLTAYGLPTFTTDVPFADATTTSTSTTSTSSSTTTTSTSSSTTTTSTSSSTSRTTSTTTSISLTTSTSTTSTSTSTTSTSTSTTSTSTTSTSSTTTIDLRIIVEKIK